MPLRQQNISPLNAKIAFAATTIACLILDQISKSLIFNQLQVGASIKVFENYFSLNHQYNPGVSFGALSNLPQPWGSSIFATISFLFIIGISIHIYRLKLPKIDEIVIYSMICGGAAGNFLDRIFRGAVLDWISVHYSEKYYFPTFNLADAFIVSGVFLILLSTMRSRTQLASG